MGDNIPASEKDGQHGNDTGNDITDKSTETKTVGKGILVKERGAEAATRGILSAYPGTRLEDLRKKKKLRVDTELEHSQSAPTTPGSNNSSISLIWDEVQASSVKNDRDEKEKPQEEDRDSIARIATMVRRTIRRIDKETRTLATLAKERNTKREIKEAAQNLRALTSQIMTQEAQEVLQKMGRKTIDQVVTIDPEVEERDTQTEGEMQTSIEKKLESLIAENKLLKEKLLNNSKEVRETGTQTSNIKEELAEMEIASELNRCKGEGEILELVKKRWPESAYKHTRVKHGDPLEEEDIVLYSRGGEMGTGPLPMAMARYPELENLGRASLEDNISSLCLATRTRESGQTRTRVKTIYKAVVEFRVPRKGN